MVLLFSFLFCSGGFLVAHGEEPGNDNTGYLPSVLLGNLNLTAGQGLAPYSGPTGGTDYQGYVDTLFSGLSGLVTAGSTTLTFPAFAIAVQGTDYQVWQEHTFDLSQLDGWFSGLMAAVRLATSVVVVGAVIHYLQSVYKDVIG